MKYETARFGSVEIEKKMARFGSVRLRFQN